MSATYPNRRAFALPELLALALIALCVIAFLSLAAHDSRRRSRAAGSIDNLRFFGSGTQTYAADNAGRFYSYTWTAGPQSTEFADLNNAATNWQATINQAIYLLRTGGELPQFTAANWLPQVSVNHLVLFQHLGLPLISRHAVSPEDAQRLAWQGGSAALLDYSPRPNEPQPFLLRHVFSSSYESGPAFWSPDVEVLLAPGDLQGSVAQASHHNQFTISDHNLPLGARRLDEVRFPASKAQLWDRHQRDLGSHVYFFADELARVPVLCVDGSVGARAASSTNIGGHPAFPNGPTPTTFRYEPDTWEPALPSGANFSVYYGRMRYTRWGLRGRDFNGPEVTAP